MVTTKAKYPGNCPDCGNEINVGDLIDWNPKTRTAKHKQCKKIVAKPQGLEKRQMQKISLRELTKSVPRLGSKLHEFAYKAPSYEKPKPSESKSERWDEIEKLFDKGAALGKQGKYEEAEKCYDEVIKIDPKYAKAWFNKGVALFNQRKFEEAIECNDEVIKIDPKYASAWLNKGDTLSKQGKHEEAEKCLDEALKIDPKDVRAWTNKGYALGEQGKDEEAQKCFEKAKELEDL